MSQRCDTCGKEIESSDLDNRVASEIEGQLFCGECMIMFEKDIWPSIS